MSDIKLFHINNNKVTELEGKSVTIEKSLQILIEKHQILFRNKISGYSLTCIKSY